MASFESSLPQSPCTEIQKYPIKRLEPTIQKFLKIIQIDIDRLRKHRANVQKYTVSNDWTNLHKENINATRTVQQVKANIREIEKTRKQINDDDLEEFDQKTSAMKYDAILTIQEFLGSIESEVSTPDDGQEEPLVTSHLPRSSSEEMTFSLHQLQVDTGQDSTEAIESWENLHENLVELNAMIHEFSAAVDSQQEVVDRIEDNIEKAQSDVRGGVTHLSKAAKYKAAVFPLAGMIIGTAIGGPIGLVAGLKIGGAVALGGGVAGFTTGRFIKKRQDRITETELKNLSEKRSNSLPDISDQQSAKSSWLPWRS